MRGTLSEGLLVLEGWREPAVSLVFLRLSPDISLSPRLGGRRSSSHNEALGSLSSPAGPNMAGICEDTVLNTLSPGTRRELISHGSLHLTPSHCLVTQVFEVQRPNFASTPDQVSNSLLVKIPALPCTRQTHLRRFCTKDVFYSRAKNCFCSPTVFQLRPAKDNASSQLPCPPFI